MTSENAPFFSATPIAMEVCPAFGGIPSLIAAIVLAVGMFGAICGFKILEVWHVRNQYSQGLGLGTATHTMGTTGAMKKGETYGAYASVVLILNGVLTAILVPLILTLMGISNKVNTTPEVSGRDQKGS